MVRIDIENKLKEIIFKRGYVLTYEEIEPSSSEDMYEIRFFLSKNGIQETYKTMYIRNENFPKRKAFEMLLDEIIDTYYTSLNNTTKTE